MLDDKSVDVVFIATPNHWHALAAIWAMQAGKDVYVEKPVSHNISEGRRIVQAARKLKRICQGGTQNRSNGGWIEAIQYMKDGKLGKVKLARSIVYGRRDSIGGPGTCEIPASVDYDLWLGPAAKVAAHAAQVPLRLALVLEHRQRRAGEQQHPLAGYLPLGPRRDGAGRLRPQLRRALRLHRRRARHPTPRWSIYDFGDKTIVAETRGLKTEPFKPSSRGGCLFFGTEGIIAEGSLFDKEGKLVRTFKREYENHFANFLKAVRSRKVSDLNADILEGHQSTALCHIGNISYRLGRSASPEEIEKQLEHMKVHEQVRETFDRTRKHLADNNVDVEQVPAHARVSAAPRF